MFRGLWLLLVLLAGPAVFAQEIARDLEDLSSAPSLAEWQRLHAGARVEMAHYDLLKDPYEVDFTRANRWCAAAVRDMPGQVVRAAMFYVPSAAQGALPTLPAKADNALTRDCRLQGIWYQTRAQVSLDALVRELSTAWGAPNGASAEPDIRGWKLWRGMVAWHRNGIDIWAAHDPEGPRLVVYARREMPRDPAFALELLSDVTKRQMVEVATQVAALGAEPVATGRLSEWLAKSKELPPTRKACALLVADTYVSSAQMGAKFVKICPQDGPVYSHNFREEAEQIDPKGLGGELAGLLSLADPCSLKGDHSWPDLLTAKGERLLSAFPADRWTPWIEYLMARAHAAKLSFAYPGGDPEGEPAALTPDAMRHEREAAIQSFRRFLQARPDTAESLFAWQEDWRLLAGLPPSALHFGCGCE